MGSIRKFVVTQKILLILRSRVFHSGSVPTIRANKFAATKHEVDLRRLDAGAPFRRHKACGYIIESLTTPLQDRHEPSLDMPCGLLGISGMPPSPESGESLP